MGTYLKFKSPQILQALVDDHFVNTPDEELTITGLALALDTTRLTLLEYAGSVKGREKDDKRFAYIIKQAKTRVEDSYERALRKNGKAGEIFGLKNLGWSDQQKIDITSKGNELGFIALPEIDNEDE